MRIHRNVNILLRCIRIVEAIMSDLYKRILEQTERLGITGKELGSLLGLKKSPMTDWKNHKSNPTIEQLIKMCEIFAISSDYLLFGKKASLTDDQQELLSTYEKLDKRGRHRIHTSIYEELDRINMPNSSSSASTTEKQE